MKVAEKAKVIPNPRGKWVEKKTKSEILVCICGERYIKTRSGQKLCIKCHYKVVR